MNNKLIIVLLLLLSFPAVKSLLQPGGFTTHDLTHHIVRQIDMDRLLSEGQFPPRWSGELAYGYGYPLFIFNYPLPALIGEVFHKIGLPAGRQGLNFLDSVKAVFFLSLIASTIGMYLFLQALFRPKDDQPLADNSNLSAFLGAIFYLYAPIHLITVYVSGSPGASMGLVFPPFICWAIVKLWLASRSEQKQNVKFLLVGSLSFAGMILSHNISAFIFMPVILAFVLVLKLVDSKKGNSAFFKNLGLMFLLGFGMSAFFWLPALFEKQYIRYDQLMKRVYLDQFPSLQQIIYSPWGYGLSHPKQPEGGMSYQIGLAHIAVMIILFFLIWRFRKNKPFLLIGIFIVLSFIISIFFMLEISLPFWDNLPFLSYVQFPLRLLVVPVFSASLAAALLIKYLPFKKVIFLALLILVLYANRNHLGINQKIDLGEEYYKGLKTSATSFDENLPIWVSQMRTDSNHGKFTVVSGQASIKELEIKSAEVLAEIESTVSARLRFNQYYFPGWEIKVDGKITDIDYQNENGLPNFDINSGKHQILAEFKNTPVRNTADSLSLISVILWIVLLCRSLIKT